MNDFIELAKNNPVDALLALAERVEELEAKLAPTEPATEQPA